MKTAAINQGTLRPPSPQRVTSEDQQRVVNSLSTHPRLLPEVVQGTVTESQALIKSKLASASRFEGTGNEKKEKRAIELKYEAGVLEGNVAKLNLGLKQASQAFTQGDGDLFLLWVGKTAENVSATVLLERMETICGGNSCGSCPSQTKCGSKVQSSAELF